MAYLGGGWAWLVGGSIQGQSLTGFVAVALAYEAAIKGPHTMGPAVRARVRPGHGPGGRKCQAHRGPGSLDTGIGGGGQQGIHTVYGSHL